MEGLDCTNLLSFRTGLHLLNVLELNFTFVTSFRISNAFFSLKYLKVWGCLGKVMLLGTKKRKIGCKTSNCIFIGYVEHNSAACRFLILKSDVFDSK